MSSTLCPSAFQAWHQEPELGQRRQQQEIQTNSSKHFDVTSIHSSKTVSKVKMLDEKVRQAKRLIGKSRTTSTLKIEKTRNYAFEINQ